MNLQQLEYIIAVDTHRHFARAAAASFVTQPTLSMMIQKLEEELGIKIFDRSKQPILPTEAGQAVIAQAKVILQDTARLKELVKELKGEIKGELKLGIIPTVAPYLLPLFLNHFVQKYPHLKVRITELTTAQIIEKLTTAQLDAAILATPLHHPGIQEQPLYYESFAVYASKQEKLMKKKYVLPTDIDVNRLWLLEEGHCMRMQMLSLCELRKRELNTANLEYEAGSIETLKKMVDLNNGITILPALAITDLSEEEKKQVRYFKSPAPVREISLVTYHHYVKHLIVQVLQQEIMQAVPAAMRHANAAQIKEIR